VVRRAAGRDGGGGLLIKGRHSRYAPGRREWWKVKHLDTVEVIVGGVLGPIRQPEVVIAGRYTSISRLSHTAQFVPRTVPRHTADHVGALATLNTDRTPEVHRGARGAESSGGPMTPGIRLSPRR
jgi:hypothetical protein